MIRLEIKKRNRDYGIITWDSTQDSKIKEFFNEVDIVDFQFDETLRKKSKVNYKYRRFNIKKTILNANCNSNTIVLTKYKKIVVITFE